jgi:hypothetical protein
MTTLRRFTSLESFEQAVAITAKTIEVRDFEGKLTGEVELNPNYEKAVRRKGYRFLSQSIRQGLQRDGGIGQSLHRVCEEKRIWQVGDVLLGLCRGDLRR